MKNIIFIFFLSTLFFSCSHKTYDALGWQSNKVTVDGRIPEWENPLRFYDDKSKINYTISNDLQNLYVCMKVSDETEQLKMLRGGMEFRIDTSGKKGFPIIMTYPMKNQQGQQHKKSENQPEKKPDDKPADHSGMKLKLLNQAKDMQLNGFKPPLGGILPLFNTTAGISAAINMDSLGIMYYEAVIPFNTFYKKELTPADSNKVFSYEIVVNGLPAPAMSGGGGGGRGMGGGGMGGGGMGGGGMGGGGMRGGGMGGGMGGGGMRGGGGGGRGGGGSYSGNGDMYVTNKISCKMKFSFKSTF